MILMNVLIFAGDIIQKDVEQKLKNAQVRLDQIREAVFKYENDKKVFENLSILELIKYGYLPKNFKLTNEFGGKTVIEIEDVAKQLYSIKEPKLPNEIAEKLKLNYEVDEYLNNAVTKAELKDYQSAIQECNKAIKLDAKNERSYFFRSMFKSNLKDYLGAIQDCNKVIEFNPKSAKAYIKRAMIKKTTNDINGAQEDLDMAGKLMPYKEPDTKELKCIENTEEFKKIKKEMDELRLQIETK